jgi:hypothetical protein
MKIAIIALVALAAAFATRTWLKLRRRVTFANTGEGTFDTGHRAMFYDTANVPVLTSRYLLVKKTATGPQYVTTTGLNDVPYGIAQDQFDANNTDVPTNVAVLGAAAGTQRVVTDGTAADGNYIKCGANGQCTLATTGDPGIFGILDLTPDELATTTSGSVVTCRTSLPSKYSF